jgi:hypothetical protein
MQWFKRIQVLTRIERDMVHSSFVNEFDFFFFLIPAATIDYDFLKHKL